MLSWVAPLLALPHSVLMQQYERLACEHAHVYNVPALTCWQSVAVAVLHVVAGKKMIEYLLKPENQKGALKGITNEKSAEDLCEEMLRLE